MEMIQKTALTLTIIGALNWGLVGFFDFNLVEALFSAGSAITRIVYALVGVCASLTWLYYLVKYILMKNKKCFILLKHFYFVLS